MDTILKKHNLEFVKSSIQSAIYLLDDVHCYETDEIENLRHSLTVLDGADVEDLEMDKSYGD